MNHASIRGLGRAVLCVAALLPCLGTAGSRAANSSGAPAASAGAASQVRASTTIVLPEPIDAALLQRELAEQTRAYAVVDVRVAWQYAEWHVPGAVNVALGAVAAHVDALPADVRVVLVDRDGTTAFAIAGALGTAPARRALRVLLGGTQAYYRVATFGGGGGVPAAAPAVVPSPATSPAPIPPKKRGAGC